MFKETMCRKRVCGLVSLDPALRMAALHCADVHHSPMLYFLSSCTALLMGPVGQVQD